MYSIIKLKKKLDKLSWTKKIKSFLCIINGNIWHNNIFNGLE